MTGPPSDPPAPTGDDQPPGRWPARTVDPLAAAVGWFGLCTGTALVTAPGWVARLAGMGRSPVAVPVARALGVRQVVHGIGILASRRPVSWLWMRLVGDVVDLGLLGLGAAAQGRGRHLFGRRRAHHRRPAPATTAALAAVAVVALVDLVAAIRLTRRRGPHRTASVTVSVDRPQDEVYRRWRELQDFPRFMSHLDLRPPAATRGAAGRAAPAPPADGGVSWDADVVHEVPGELIEWRSRIAAAVDHAGTVHFEPDPAGTGTRVTVRVDYRPPGGLLGSLLAGFLGEHPRQQISDDLLRFKHVMEAADD